MKKYLIVVCVLFVNLVFTSCNHSVNETKVEEKEMDIRYKCPMGCENDKTYDKPGKCPICEMDLEKAEKNS